MKLSRSWILGGLAVPALLALARPADEIVFSPTKGLRLTKTFALEVESAIDDMEMILNGNPTEAPPIEVETLQSTSITVTDHYVESEGGRTLVLERTFDGLSSDMDLSMEHPMTGAQDVEAESESDLEGLTVIFAWDEDDEEFSTAFSEDDSDEDEDLLEGLAQDMDLIGFLPDEPVSVDDSWSFDPSAVIAILAPGGNLKLIPQDMPEGMDSGAGVDFSQYLGEVEGDCTAEYQGRKRVDDRAVAIIHVTMEVSSNKDVTDFIAMAAEAAGDASGMEMEQDVQSADVSLEIELDGELLWDLEGGHFHSLEVSGSMDLIMDVAVTVNAMGQTMEVEQSVYSSGSISISASLTSE